MIKTIVYRTPSQIVMQRCCRIRLLGFLEELLVLDLALQYHKDPSSLVSRPFSGLAAVGWSCYRNHGLGCIANPQPNR